MEFCGGECGFIWLECVTKASELLTAAASEDLERSSRVGCAVFKLDAPSGVKSALGSAENFRWRESADMDEPSAPPLPSYI